MSLYFGGNGITYTHTNETNKNIFELHNNILHKEIENEKLIKYLDKNNIDYYIYYKPSDVRMIPTNYKNKDCISEEVYYSQFNIDVSLIYSKLCSLEKRLDYLKSIGFIIIDDTISIGDKRYIVHLRAKYHYRKLNEYKYKAVIKTNDKIYDIFIKDNINLFNRLKFNIMHSIHSIVKLK